jgi:DNA-binding CsgD family transcriptional regulator
MNASQEEAENAPPSSFEGLGKLIATGAELPPAPQHTRGPVGKMSNGEAQANAASQLLGAGGLGSLSADRGDSHRIFLREFADQGIVDAVQMVIPHPTSHSFLLFTARHHNQRVVPEQAKQRWINLQAHIGAVYDLRQRLRDNSFDEAGVVWFDTSGNCVAEGPAVYDDIRERLRDAVLAREAARKADTVSKRVDLERYWANVISGRWAILDHFDTDGKRFVIALPVSKYGNRLRGMSNRELETLRMLGEGMSNKAIAAALFVSESAISTHLGNVYQKLGIHDRVTVVQLVQALRKSGKL